MSLGSEQQDVMPSATMLLATFMCKVLVEALRLGAVSVPEVVQAVIVRTAGGQPDAERAGRTKCSISRVNVRNGAARRRGVYGRVEPTYIKENVAVVEMPPMQGTRCVVAVAEMRSTRRSARVFLATGLRALWKDADVGVRLQRVG